MPSYKLTYFDISGLAEPIRYMFCLLGEDFEDNRVKMEEWAAVKPTTPFGKLPMLEVDGKVVTQSTAICRFLGKKAKLAGKDEWEDLQIDMMIDTFHDLRQALSDYYREKDEDSKAKKLEALKSETFPFYFGKFDEIVKKNNGYLANGRLSWGDIYFIGGSLFFKTMTGYDFTEHFENLKHLFDTVMALPQIKKWNDSRAKDA